ncbi:alpha-E domain-containing protein [uncultured Brevundimonas sp.]|uniref:alpha-E domain-containing protein n=1 Tax=uncultured Brevundimonas sp. TaxID=213418 RepID=UPI0030EDB3A1|tara:strand:- start:4796 stop:5737 length:942 start_codon:yes stop_codon:yes gene_type:complete
MLGKTAGGLFWMFRYLERSENTARLVDAGFRIALTRSVAAEAEWASVIATAGVRDAYLQRYDTYGAKSVIDFLLRDPANSSSVMSVIDSARSNARLVRTALTREVWEATNEGWMSIKAILKRPVSENDLPDVLADIRRQNALVRGALTGTMLRNDVYNFAHLGTFVERADNTARILDVKYYVLLPSVSFVGSSLDNVQWETILRSVSAQRAYRWLSDGNANPRQIANLVILDQRLPRSLAYCAGQICENLDCLAATYGNRLASHDLAKNVGNSLAENTVESIFDTGLHQFLSAFIASNTALGHQIERDYRFSG